MLHILNQLLELPHCITGNQSINQSIHPSIHPSINQSIIVIKRSFSSITQSQCKCWVHLMQGLQCKQYAIPQAGLSLLLLRAKHCTCVTVLLHCDVVALVRCNALLWCHCLAVIQCLAAIRCLAVTQCHAVILYSSSGYGAAHDMSLTVMQFLLVYTVSFQRLSRYCKACPTYKAEQMSF